MLRDNGKAKITSLPSSDSTIYEVLPFANLQPKSYKIRTSKMRLAEIEPPPMCSRDMHTEREKDGLVAYTRRHFESPNIFRFGYRIYVLRVETIRHLIRKLTRSLGLKNKIIIIKHI